MPGFNHYARLARLITDLAPGWYILRIDEPTTATTFAGQTRHYDHYYRLMTVNGDAVRYGKFQQIERLASALDTPVESLPVIEP